MAKKDRLEYVKSYWKGSEIYCFSRSVTRNFLCRSTMVVDISEDFEPPSKKFLATPLQTGKISALSSINVGKNDFLTGAEVLTEKALLEKAATIKTFEYWVLVNELKKQTYIVGKQYQELTKFYGFDKGRW